MKPEPKKKTAREAFVALQAGAAALQPDVEAPDIPEDVPVEVFLGFGALNCAMWGASVHRIEEGSLQTTREKRSEALRMLGLACECYLAALKELRS
jgi:hypothetical protein